MYTRHQWIKALRKASGLNQTKFGELVGTTQSSVARWEHDAVPELHNWKALQEVAEQFNFPAFDEGTRNTVPLVGFVSAGATVILHSLGQGPFDQVVKPIGATELTVAVAVRGDSMTGTADNGWLIYFENNHDSPHDGLYGRLCVVGLSDGTVMVKKLFPGRQPGRYDLYSTNGPPILDQEVEWAAPVEWIKPR